MKKVCLTTFVYGDKYQAYIPFLAYSCNKAYPEYDMHIFIYGELSPDIKAQVESLGLKISLKIHEHTFSDFQKMTPFLSKTLRWLLWDDVFLNYDYLYTVDIDMLYIREPIPLHEQHEAHMKMLNLPFSNIARKLIYNPLDPITFLRTFKNFGLVRAISSLAISRTQYRITGLHFVDVKTYYSYVTKEFLDGQRNLRKNGIMPKGIYRSSDEIYHYKILQDAGFDLSGLPIQTDRINMLDPTPDRLEFRPYHGIHMGSFRSQKLIDETSIEFAIPIYKFYFYKFKTEIANDPLFVELVEAAPEFIKASFQRLNDLIKN